MIGELFYWVINMSIFGSICGIIMLCLRKIKVIPNIVIYLLWFVVGFRLWLPFGIVNPYSLLTFISQYTTKTVSMELGKMNVSASNFIQSAESYFPIRYKTDVLEQIFEIGGILWLIIMVACILTSIRLYFLTKAEVKKAIQWKDNIYISDKIETPAVYGVFQSKIILPSKVGEGDIDYIVMHEKVHIQRRDNLWRIAAVVTICVHWFNPFSWFMLKAFFEDMELACDSQVLRKIENPREYARAILNVSQGKVFYVSAFGGAKTKVRIENVLSYKKLTIVSTVASAIFILSVMFALLTNAM